MGPVIFNPERSGFAANSSARMMGRLYDRAAIHFRANGYHIVILTDDRGWADLGAQGADKDIRTPNLDQLARDGVRFARGYVTAPQCTPSRVGLMTGR